MAANQIQVLRPTDLSHRAAGDFAFSPSTPFARAQMGEEGGREGGEGQIRSGGQRVEVVPETLDALFAFKRRIRPSLANVPVVEEETPMVCAWYPSAKRVLLWNLLPEPRRVTVSFRGRQRLAELGPLGSAVLEGFPA